MVDKVVNEKYYRKTNTEYKVDLILFFFVCLFFRSCFSFSLPEVSIVSNYYIKLLSKLIPINLSQYRGVVGAFNSQSIHINQHGIFKNVFSQSKMKQTIANEIFTVFTILSIFLLISSSWSFINLLRSKSKFVSLSFVRIS